MLLVVQHPVLTQAGFVAFRFIHCTDKLICPIHYYLISVETGLRLRTLRMEVLLASTLSVSKLPWVSSSSSVMTVG